MLFKLYEYQRLNFKASSEIQWQAYPETAFGFGLDQMAEHLGVPRVKDELDMDLRMRVLDVLLLKAPKKKERRIKSVKN